MQSLENNKAIFTKPSEEFLNKRTEYLKGILLDFTIKQHERLMKKLGIKFDPVKAGTWHSEFNLEQVRGIEKFTLFPVKGIVSRV